MKAAVFCIVCAMILSFISCKKDGTSAPPMKQVELTPKQKDLISSSNAFGFVLFRKVVEQSGAEGNLMISPLSISMALGMTRNGAANATLDAMNQALGLKELTDQEANESFRYIMNSFSALDPSVKVSIANSIWYRNTFNVLPSFMDVNMTYFNAEVSSVDFDDPGTVNTINNWVSEKTNKLIPKIVDQIPAEMVMYLINAVYFKGQWRYSFDKKKTADKPFYLHSGTTRNVPSMVQRADLLYYRGDGFQAAELPYNQGNYNMNILLPDEGVTLTGLIEKLTAENWALWSANYVKTDVQLQMPRFKFQYEEKQLKQVLTAMGMGVAFDEYHADFTRINPEGNLFISEIKHKTYIETNEEGTEAAAVTSVGMATTSIGQDPQPVVLTVDRPFVFMISEKSTGTILFIGKVNNPVE